MQPGYPNPHLPPQLPQNPMSSMPPVPGSFPAPISKPMPAPQPSYTPPPQAPYSPPPQPPSQPSFTPAPQPRPMNDIAPPQSYGHNPPQPSYTPPPQAPYSPPPQPPSQPGFTPAPQPRPMNDIAPPPQSYSQPPYPQNPMQPMPPPSAPFTAVPQPPTQQVHHASRPQMVQDIPIRTAAPSGIDQFNTHPYSPPQQRPENPFNTPRPIPSGEPFADNHMEDILKDVNRNVSRPDPKVRKNPITSIAGKLKLATLKNHTKKAVSQPKPMMIVVLAAVAFISLAMAAFFAFNGDSVTRPIGPEIKVVGTAAAAGDSIQAGGGTLVSSQEVVDLTESLNKQINGFNETQDFGQDPLTDQALGL